MTYDFYNAFKVIYIFLLLFLFDLRHAFSLLLVSLTLFEVRETSGMGSSTYVLYGVSDYSESSSDMLSALVPCHGSSYSIWVGDSSEWGVSTAVGAPGGLLRGAG